MFGKDILTAHVPDLQRGGWLLVGLIVAFFFSVATALLVFVDRLWPAWTGVGQMVLIFAGFGCTAPFFWRRKTYLALWGKVAYRNAILRHVLPGLPMIFAALAHTAYLPGTRLALGWATSIKTILFWYFAVTGLILWGRAVLAFGFDNLAMLYVYFPDEGRLVDTTVYGIVRHPVYSAVCRIGLALGLWRGTWFSIAFGLFMPIGLTLWLWLVEERELIERFGQGYRDYRRQVPAFWPRLQNFGKFLKFLATGK
jgi:protein-S-isoprenylcysteine O-methyltransferase Ste14